MSLVQVRQEIDEKLDTLDAEMLKAIHTILYAQSEEVQNGRSSFSRKSSGLAEGEVDYDVNV